MDAYGHNITSKAATSFRFGSHNINTIKTTKKFTLNESEQDRRLRSLVKKLEIDVLALQEPNINWTAVPANQQLQEKTRGWFEDVRVQTAHNIHPDETATGQGAILTGGTVIMAINRPAVSRVMDRCVDPSGLGRWCYIRMQGQHGMACRFYSAYNPCVNRSGENSVHRQHERVLMSRHDMRTPQKAFLEDLQAELQIAKDAGDQIVLGADLNMDLYSTVLDEFYEALNLQETFIHHHGKDGPRTFLTAGSRKVDAIIHSNTLQVTACGYLAAEWSIGDHRILIADFTYVSTFGHAQPASPTKTARRLQLSDPRVVDKYLAELRKLFKENRIHIRAENLFIQASEDPSNIDAEAFDSVLWDLHQCTEIAESKCRKFKTGGVEYSDVIGKYSFTIKFWINVVKSKQGMSINRRHQAFLDMFRMDPITTPIEAISLRRAHRILRDQRRTYRKHAKKDAEYRLSYLTNICVAASIKSNTTVESKMKQMINREASRKMHAMIKSTKPPRASKAAAELEAPPLDDPYGEQVLHNTKDAVEEAALQHLDRKFRQAFNTPALQPEFVEEFGLYAEKEAAQQVLNGTYEYPSGMDPFLVDLLKHCERPGSAPSISATMTMKEFQATWKRGVKERTSSCPKSPHFGHFMAMAQDNFLSQVMAWLLSVPMLSGFSPVLYRRMTACLLQKKPGNIQVDKQRFILLLDGMFSNSCRFMARKTAQQAERLQLLAKEQFGSRKHLDALQQAVNLRITMDLALQLHQPTSVVCNDLVSCYDRIVHAICSLLLQQVGHTRGAVVCRFSTTQQLEVNVRTAFGDSALTNNTGLWLVPLTPIHSILQGSPDGPINWAIVSTPVLQCMREQGYGVAYKCAISQEGVDLVGTMFVDDASYFQTAPSNKGDDVIDETQRAQTHLRGLLFATGAALNPTKSFWWLIDFKWTGGVWSFKKIAQTPGDLMIRDQHGTLVALERHEFNEAKRVLGVQMAPEDKGKSQTAVLRQKAQDWADYAVSRKINPSHAWYGILTGIMKGLEWPLTAAPLTVKQCKYILAPLLKVGLRASGIQWLLKRSILHGSPEVCGVGFPFLHTTGGIQRLLYLANHGHKHTLSGSLVRATFEQLQLEIGLPGNLFQWKHHDFRFITTMTWISSIWKFASDNGILVTPSTPELKVRREGDVFLMAFFHSRGITEKALRPLQKCRTFLGATTLSDITNAEGTHICEQALAGHRRKFEPLHYNYALQGNPTGSDWNDFRIALSPLTHEGLGDYGRKLRQPLGPWIDGDRAKWLWFYVPAEDRLYHRTADSWEFFSHRGRSSHPRGGVFTGPFPADALPVSAQRARVTDVPRRSNVFRYLGHGPEDPASMLPVLPVQTNSFRAFIHTLKDPFQRYLFEKIEGCSEEAVAAIAASITQGTARVVSDGSYFSSTGQAAFQLRLEDGAKTHQIVVTQYVPGPKAVNDAYRAEAAGIMTVFLLLKTLCDYAHIEAGHIKVGCDGESALNTSTNPDWDVRVTDKHHDILTCTHSFRNLLPITIDPIWVKGHQDEGPKAIPYRRMARLTQLNVDCDRGAKQLASTIQTHNAIPVSSQLWTISLAGVQLVNDIEKQLREGIHDPELLEYWNRNELLKLTQHHLVDWEARKHATENATHRRRLWVTKTYSDNCATGLNMVRWGYRDSCKCARCGAIGEDVNHIIRCPAPIANARWNKSCDVLDTWLGSVSTSPHLRKYIVLKLRTWHAGEEMRYLSPDLHQLFAEQDELGWRNFLFGFVSIQWQQIQQAHYDSFGSQRTGKRWVSALIRKVWDIAWDQWDQRNGILHGKGKLDEYEDTDELNSQIRQQFSSGPPPNCPRQYQRHFRYTAVDQLLALSNLERRLWLRTVLLVRQMTTNLDGMRRERANMQAWLATFAPPVPP